MKILTIEMGDYHASEHYRTEGPLRALEAQGVIDFTRLPVPDFADVKNLEPYDIFYLWNPGHEQAIALVKMAMEAGLRIWVDFDDDFENIPIYHPIVNKHDVNVIAENYRAILQVADAVSVTTKRLYHIASQYNENVHIIPNAWPRPMEVEVRSVGEPVRIGYRGNYRHEEDLREVKDNFVNHENIMYYFFGFMPHFLVGSVPFQFHAWINGIEKFQNRLRANALDWVIVPMIDNNFNEAISNIAWLEATYSGAAVLAPDYLPEFSCEKIPAFNYRNKDEFSQILLAIGNGELDQIRTVLVEDSVKYINEELTLATTNLKRIDLCTQLVETSLSA